MHAKLSVVALSVAAAFALGACGKKEEPKPVAAARRAPPRRASRKSWSSSATSRR
ncbi:MAG: hypothetical protein MZW92_00530 [Comamonadaceae bacterium]|nr:hypothetical protein [Comamonadaceae bacterium]